MLLSNTEVVCPQQHPKKKEGERDVYIHYID